MATIIDISQVPCLPENFEPLLKLGLCFDVKKMTDESIKCYQKCVRIKSDDRKVWQCLGQAYYNRGSYVNACKCFMKASQLGENGHHNYEQIRLGEIKLLLGSCDEASELYENVLKKEPDNVLGMIGMAKIKLFEANEKLQSEQPEEGKNLVAEIFSMVQKIILIRPDMILPYNLVANCCIMCAIRLTEGNSIETVDKSYTRKDLLLIAKRHLLKALSLKDYQYLWYNLFIVYALLYRETKQLEDLKKALFCLEK